jgi:hypothetical protein
MIHPLYYIQDKENNYILYSRIERLQLTVRKNCKALFLIFVMYTADRYNRPTNKEYRLKEKIDRYQEIVSIPKTIR